MPPIYVEFLPGTLDHTTAEKLKKVLREDATKRFSIQDRQLNPDDFSPIFVPLNEWSEPSHDIIVRVTLHHDEERLIKDDADAVELAEVIAKALEELMVDEKVTIGVALSYLEVAWGTATAQPNFLGDPPSR